MKARWEMMKITVGSEETRLLGKASSASCSGELPERSGDFEEERLRPWVKVDHDLHN